MTETVVRDTLYRKQPSLQASLVEFPLTFNALLRSRLSVLSVGYGQTEAFHAAVGHGQSVIATA